MAAKKTTKKSTVTKVANALSESIGRIGSKVNSITGSARDTIVTQIDTAIKNRKNDLAREADLNKKRIMVETARAEKSAIRENYGSVRASDDKSAKAKDLSDNAQRELEQLKQAELQWKKFKKGIGFQGKPKTKKK